VLAVALAVAMWWLASAAPSPPWRSGMALGVFMLAGLVGFPAIRSFRRAGTTIDPVRIDRASTLVTGGIYRVTRNPMYLSLALLLAAWALWLGGPWVWAGPILLVLWLDRFQIRPEERAMAMRFGEAYARYRSEVRRWL
jgi:protein-S-isoprenylcysteine O-methyltransferase Ste14